MLLPATSKDDDYEIFIIPNAWQEIYFVITNDLVKRSPTPKLIRPKASSTDLNSKSIEPQLITMKSNDSLKKHKQVII